MALAFILEANVPGLQILLGGFQLPIKKPVECRSKNPDGNTCRHESSIQRCSVKMNKMTPINVGAMAPTTAEELPSWRFNGADSGPGETFLGAKFEPQVGIGVKVEGGAEGDFRVPVRPGVEAGAAVGVGNCSGARNEAAVEVGDRLCAGAEIDGARVLPSAQPWSVHPRSKDRSSHRLVLHYIVPCMNSYGMCFIDNFLGSKTGDRILQEVWELHRAGRMQDGELASRGLEHTKSIRGDQIAWVEGKELGCESIGYLLSRMDKLITDADGKLGNHKIRGRNSKVGA